MAGHERQAEHPNEIKHALFIFGMAVERLVGGESDDLAVPNFLRDLDQLRDIRAQGLDVLRPGGALQPAVAGVGYLRPLLEATF